MFEQMTRKQQSTVRAQVLAEESCRKIRRRCASILTHQREKAEKLKIAPPNYDVDELVKFVGAAIGQRCRYCEKKITASNFELDHDTPLARNGTFTLANTHVVIAACNKKKGGLTGAEFTQLLDFLTRFPDVARADVLQRLGIGGKWKR